MFARRCLSAPHTVGLLIDPSVALFLSRLSQISTAVIEYGELATYFWVTNCATPDFIRGPTATGSRVASVVDGTLFDTTDFLDLRTLSLGGRSEAGRLRFLLTEDLAAVEGAEVEMAVIVDEGVGAGGFKFSASNTEDATAARVLRSQEALLTEVASRLLALTLRGIFRERAADFEVDIMR